VPGFRRIMLCAAGTALPGLRLAAPQIFTQRRRQSPDTALSLLLLGTIRHGPQVAPPASLWQGTPRSRAC
jgi:hypothetical protein